MNKNIYSVYKYCLRYCETVKALIRLCESHPDNVMLLFRYDFRRDIERKELFNTEAITVYLYCQKNLYCHEKEAIHEEISKDNILKGWYDADCYELTDERVNKLKKDTEKALIMLKAILNFNSKYESLLSYGM